MGGKSKYQPHSRSDFVYVLNLLTMSQVIKFQLCLFPKKKLTIGDSTDTNA